MWDNYDKSIVGSLWFLIFIMMESILLENVVEKIHLNCNGEMLVIDGNNAGIGGEYKLSEAISLLYIYI